MNQTFNIGDKVKIARKVDVGYWISPMDRFVGKSGEVIGMAPMGTPRVEADGRSFLFPAGALELLNPVPQATPVKTIPAYKAPRKPAAKKREWTGLATTLATFSYSDGDKISWRQIAKMIDVPKSTVSDFLRKGGK